MFVAATLNLLTAILPQGPSGSADAAAQDPQPILSEREHKSLNDKLRKYLAAELAYEWAEGSKNRQKASKARRKAKEKFEADWKKTEKKGDLLSSMPDLLRVFHNCFELKKPSHTKGQLRKRAERDSDRKLSFFVPKTYKQTIPYRTMLVLPGSKGTAGEWEKPEDYWKKTWLKQQLLEDSIVILPVVRQGLELDPIPDYSREGAEIEERERTAGVFGALGEIMRNYNVDRAKVFLDCGRDTCGYGLRLAALFPDRFAGIILRDAVEVDDLRIGSLRHVPILALKTSDNASRVDALAKRFGDRWKDSVTVLDAKGAYPHLESAPEIAAWTDSLQRNMSPLEVTLEPNHDRFNNAYWVDIHTAEALQTAAPDEKARLDVKVDRAANRITVTSVGVERFELLLNDTLVDLDKEFTIVINGTAVTEKRTRSFRLMKDNMEKRSDWQFLFPVRYVTSVPKE